MSFLDTILRAKAYLEHPGRVSVRALRREFDLDDDALEELIEELVEIQRVATRDGRALAWLGATPPLVRDDPATPIEAAAEDSEATTAAEAERWRRELMARRKLGRAFGVYRGSASLRDGEIEVLSAAVFAQRLRAGEVIG